jgi:ABC-type xylose transport system substrate-binding protein
MSSLVIVTNNVPRGFLYWTDLTEKEKKNFDYLKTEDDQMNATFFAYRGHVYDLGEFMRIENHSNHKMSKWDGYSSDSAFSGVLVKYTKDLDEVIVGRYMS